jgi:hypothetical protein
MGETGRLAALGFRAHAGWAAAVSLAGPVEAPVLVGRQRVMLTDGPLPWEPYHAAKRLDPAEAEAFIGSAAAAARSMASDAIRGALREVESSGHRPSSVGIVLGSGRPDFTLKQALSTHAAMHNAGGVVFPRSADAGEHR